MTVDKWFNKQNLLIKILLLIIPFVGWVTEVLVRVSVVLRKKDLISILALIAYLVIGWMWIPVIIDFVVLICTGHLFLAGD